MATELYNTFWWLETEKLVNWNWWFGWWHHQILLTRMDGAHNSLFKRYFSNTPCRSNWTQGGTHHNSSPIYHQQSGQITGSGTVPNLVQVYLIWCIKSHIMHRADPNCFKFLTAKLQRNVILLRVFTKISFCTPKITV